LDRTHVLEINKSLKYLTEKFNYELDVEWSIGSGKLYFVQARPITGYINGSNREINNAE